MSGQKKIILPINTSSKKWFVHMCKPLLSPLLLAAMTLVGLNSLVEPFIVKFISYSFESEKDRAAYVANRVHSDSKSPTIWHFGGSSFRQAFDDDFNLNSRVNNKLNFINLSHIGQSFIESLAIIRKTNIKKGDLVVLQTSIHRLNRIQPHPKRVCRPNNHLLFHKDIVETLEEFDLPRGDVPFTCYFSIVAKKLVLRSIIKNMLKGEDYVFKAEYKGIYPEEFDTDPSALKERRQSAIRIRKEKGIRKSRDYYNKFDSKSAELFKKIIRVTYEHVTSRGATLIILDLPQNSEGYEMFHPNYDRESFEKNQNRAIAEIIAEKKIPYYNFRWHPDFKFDDFYDSTHLLQVGRDKFYPMYMKVVLPFFKELNLEK